jgi:hypothetical protein
MDTVRGETTKRTCDQGMYMQMILFPYYLYWLATAKIPGCPVICENHLGRFGSTRRQQGLG